MNTTKPTTAPAVKLFKARNSVTGLFYEIGKSFTVKESQASLLELQQAAAVHETYSNVIVEEVVVTLKTEHAALLAIAESQYELLHNLGFPLVLINDNGFLSQRQHVINRCVEALAAYEALKG